MRALIAGALPPNPWLLGAFAVVLILFGVVMALSLKLGKPKDEIQKDAELPFKD